MVASRVNITRQVIAAQRAICLPRVGIPGGHRDEGRCRGEKVHDEKDRCQRRQPLTEQGVESSLHLSLYGIVARTTASNI